MCVCICVCVRGLGLVLIIVVETFTSERLLHLLGVNCFLHRSMSCSHSPATVFLLDLSAPLISCLSHQQFLFLAVSRSSDSDESGNGRSTNRRIRCLVFGFFSRLVIQMFAGYYLN